MDIRLAEVLRRLKGMTDNCEDDMNNIFDAKVSGTYLNSANGADPCRNNGAFTVLLVKRVDTGYDGPGAVVYDDEWFNLADLIALARMAKD